MKVFDQARELMGQGKQENALEEMINPLVLTDESGHQVNLARVSLRLRALLEKEVCSPPAPEVLYALLLKAFCGDTPQIKDDDHPDNA